MADESELREQQARGERAAIALKELEAAFRALEQDCFETFRESDIHDDMGRKTCRFYLRVMDDVKQRFEIAVSQGEAARTTLIKLRGPSLVQRIRNG